MYRRLSVSKESELLSGGKKGFFKDIMIDVRTLSQMLCEGRDCVIANMRSDFMRIGEEKGCGKDS